MRWKEEYAIGIPQLDDQHKALIAQLTEFEYAFEGKAHWNTMHPLIVRTREFLRFHFAVEESVMQIVAYPGFPRHRSEHQDVLQQFETLEHRVLRKEMKEAVLPNLTSWLFDHIIDSDRPFAEFALGKLGSLAPAVSA
jgi:hemerythrin-like metal-binding protein